jgi:hypothetical protein
MIIEMIMTLCYEAIYPQIIQHNITSVRDVWICTGTDDGVEKGIEDGRRKDKNE